MDELKYPCIAKFLKTDLIYYGDDYPKEQADLVRKTYFGAMQEVQECIREIVALESIETGVDSIEITMELPHYQFDVVSAVEVRNVYGSVNEGTNKEAMPNIYTPFGRLTGGVLEYLICNYNSPVSQFLHHIYSAMVWLNVEMEKVGVLSPHMYTYNLVTGYCIDDPLMLFPYVVDYAGFKEIFVLPDGM